MGVYWPMMDDWQARVTCAPMRRKRLGARRARSAALGTALVYAVRLLVHPLVDAMPLAEQLAGQERDVLVSPLINIELDTSSRAVETAHGGLAFTAPTECAPSWRNRMLMRGS